MDNKINGRTLEEIKRGLACSCVCSEIDLGCKTCPYLGDNCPDVHSDALAYIQQLEQDNAQKDERIRQLEREMEVLLKIAEAGACETCKYTDNRTCEYPCCECEYCDGEHAHWTWEWRGVEGRGDETRQSL